MAERPGHEAPPHVWKKYLPHAFPFLFAILTVTALVASNPFEGVRAHNLVIPLAMSTGVAAASWAVVVLLIPDRLRCSLAALAISLPILLSGYLFGWLRVTDLPETLASGVEVALLLLVVAAAILAVRRIRWPAEMARFLNLFGLLGMLVSAPALVPMFTSSELPVESSTALPDTADIIRPDIYFVLLDAYTGSESLRLYYGFDNTPFLDSLRARELSIAEGQRSNYIKTFLSVSSILNRDYVNELMAQSAPKYRDRSHAYNRMEFNRTTYDLKRLGYDFYYVGSSYPPLASNRLADEGFSRSRSLEFERFWLQSTGLLPLRRLYCRATGRCKLPELPFQPETAAETESRLAYLTSLVHRPGPKFVFAHVMLPHGPFRFGSDCEPRRSRWTVGPNAIESESTLRRLYVEQLQCTNHLILALVDSIRANSPGEPMIVLQSDHGGGRFVGGLPTDLGETAPDQVRERFDIFAAYSGPDALGDSLAAAGTPVNVFRTLFRAMWKVDEPPLYNRSYWSERERPLFLTRVSLE